MSLAKNIFYNQVVDQNNPYFIKKKKEVPETDYRARDLVEF